MNWLLFLLAAGGALFFLYRARTKARTRFDEILEREAQETRRRKGLPPEQDAGTRKKI